MKRIVTVMMLMAIWPLMLSAQTYDELWLKVREAAAKDLPKTQMELLEKISKKATKEKDYGQLLSATLMKGGLQTQISPDSLEVETERLKANALAAEKKDPVFAAVYYTALAELSKVKRGTLDYSSTYYKKALENPELLAKHKAAEYKPLISIHEDSRIFNDDLLHVIGMAAGKYQLLQDYYDKAGNRAATCIAASKKYSSTAEWDSLINVYGDLPEAGELAKRRYKSMPYRAAERVKYIDYALEKWKDWPHMGELVDQRNELTQTEFYAMMNSYRVLPGKGQKMYLSNVRNMRDLKVTFTKLNIDGRTDLRPYSVEDNKKLVAKKVSGEPAFSRTLNYADKAEYDIVRDTIDVDPLPVGVYLVEFSVNGETLSEYSELYYVSDLHVFFEEQPNFNIRYVVVNATTGQPVPGASIVLKTQRGYNSKKDEVVELTADSKGEVIHTYKNRSSSPDYVYVCTKDDKAFPITSLRTSFSYYKDTKDENMVSVYTDRSIYRPGQVVHASAIVFHRSPVMKREAVAGKSVEFVLMDANWKVVKEITQVTDDYGVAAADFTLPSSGLTGRFTVKASCGKTTTRTIRVEEYKRPTFEVEIPEYKERYAKGDTINVTGVAKTYAGVAVQGATVKYTVKRGSSYWRWYYNTDNDERLMKEGTTTTDADGKFKVPVILTLPASSSSDFYTFNISAEVTDVAGESHEGSLRLPLGRKPTVLGCDIPAKVQRDSLKQITFSYLNASGNEIDGTVNYTIDNGKKVTVKANTPHKLTVPINSGEHVLQGICGTDTVTKKFVVFSMTDKKPVVKTDDWFFVTDKTFHRDGTPVYIQVGSSAPQQHIVYSIIAEDSLLENGAIDQSDALNTRAFTYKKEYGEGLTITYAWMKDGKCYKHSTTIKRPLPDKRLKLEWKTFRNKLTPGQKETWTLSVKHPNGKPADAQLMATLYDKSLDQIARHSWLLDLNISQSLANADWGYPTYGSLTSSYSKSYKRVDKNPLNFSQFNQDCFDIFDIYRSDRLMMLKSASGGSRARVLESAPMMAEAVDEEVVTVGYANNNASKDDNKKQQEKGGKEKAQVQLRENLNETAFFYPQLVADANGNVNIQFTLPESVTTWKFMGIAHDKQMNNGSIQAEAIAAKTVMVQPNMPRFVRQGDKANLSARLFNTSEKTVKGVAKLELIDPETEKVVMTRQQDFSVGAKGTGSVTFVLDDLTQLSQTLLIARTTVVGDGYSDGEQHYLPVLPNKEQVINTFPFTQHTPGVQTVDLNKLFPQGTTQQKLTVEYTDNPAWLMIQALPSMAEINEKNAISLTMAFYANSLAREIMKASPKVKTTIELWKKEKGAETSLMSSLQKNESLKDLTLNETPWVLDAENEEQQKQALIQFFDDNLINNRLKVSIDNLKKLQNGNGSWSWWPGMSGSIYMTTSISKMLVRLNSMIGERSETKAMLNNAFDFMADEFHKEVRDLKKLEKKGEKHLRPSELAVDYLYTCALDGRKLSSSAKADHDYLLQLLAKKTREFTIYGKAVTAVILAKNGYDKLAAEYLQSIKEYTVYKEEMGRYFDTPKAYYSWFDYKIPTEVASIEALKTITPDDRQTIEEMQRWLLMCKRTQAWDTPFNSVNAVFAFSENGQIEALAKNEPAAQLKLDDTLLDMSNATAGLGYVKTTVNRHQEKTFTADKTSSGTSWGAVYAQFFQPVTEIADAASGITVTREIIPITQTTNQPSDQATNFKVGDKVKVRITITADRDYDFVQVIDKRAACLEPVNQLSGYRNGYYTTPKDCSTNYYFDCLSKGKHVITTDYYIDREGSYQSGTCTAQCAYAPEYSGRDKGVVINVKP